MTEEFRPLIADYLHIITKAIQGAPAEDTVTPAHYSPVMTWPDPPRTAGPSGAADTPPSDEPAIVALGDAERLEGESYLFPAEADDERTGWEIFERPVSGAEDVPGEGAPPAAYAWRSGIAAGCTAPQFVAGAFSGILHREADPEGAAYYGRLLGQASISRRELLKTLICSAEARGLPHRFLIVPRPSRWLPAPDASGRTAPSRIMASL